MFTLGVFAVGRHYRLIDARSQPPLTRGEPKLYGIRSGEGWGAAAYSTKNKGREGFF